MKKILLFILCIILLQVSAIANEAEEAAKEAPSAAESPQAPVFYTAAQQERNTFVFAEKNRFGLKDKDGKIILPAEYQKIIMAGKNGWIVQIHNKYGLANSKGEYIIKPKYRYADRILGRYIKLGNDHDFGLYNEFGEVILEPEYSSIDLLYGKMFLTYKNYRYGVTDFKGNELIPNICDDIFMPTKDTMKIKYYGVWYDLENVNAEKLAMPLINKDTDTAMTLKDFFAETGAISGYSVLTLSEYLIKIISSLSPAHEETIDELILSHGVDTVGILKKFTWIPKYPVTFSKNYYEHLVNPFNGPLSDTRSKLKGKVAK